ncbi:MAG: TetR/AcrR family transcriptional regulator [Myxococcales bacterium]|nr:TetR/AcrR family transcriptional regulator [Myxococcales bacterium]
MAVPSEAPPLRRRGRPLDPALDRVVLDATVEILRLHGYRRLRVDDVAAQAGVGLGALYRRWPTKRDLVIAALAEAAPDRSVPATGDAMEDVFVGLLEMARGFAGPRSRILSGLLSELPDDPELAEAVRGTLIATLRSDHRERMRRLVGDAPDLEERTDLGPAWVLFHGLLLGRAVTETELRRVLPILVGQQVPRARAARSEKPALTNARKKRPR